jgi:phosphopantetheinyl transferase
MPIDTIISWGETKLLVWEITESIDELLQQVSLSEFELAAFEKFGSSKRKREFLGVRLALKNLVGEHRFIYYHPDGKPYLQGNDFHISISHSDKWIAVMADPTHSVGIDIECPSKKMDKIYRRFLSETEQKELYAEKDIRKLQIAWSAKEALYKIIGKQAVDFANQLHIFPFEVKIAGEITANHIPTNTFFQLYYSQTEAYTLVYCNTSKKEKP